MKKALPWIVAILVALSGCLGIGEDPLSEDPEDSDPDATGDGEETNAEGTTETTGDGNETAPQLEATLTANVTEGEAPLMVSFNITGTADMPVSWSLDLGDGSETERGDVLPFILNHTYEEDGNHTVLLNVTMGDQNIEANLTIIVHPGGHPTGTATYEASTGGATSPFTEILSVHAEVDEETLTVAIELEDLPPSLDVFMPFSYSIWVDDHGFDSFIRYPIDNNPMTWDDTDSSYMPAGTSQWDGTTVTFYLPLDYLEANYGLVSPFELYATANIGSLPVYEVDDRAPESGTFTAPE